VTLSTITDWLSARECIIIKIIVHLYGQIGCLVAEILLERDKVSLTGIEISPYKHLRAG
jgi:hypothetical protein